MALAVPPGGTPPPPELRLDAVLPKAQSVVLPDSPRRRSAPAVPAISVVIVNFCQWRNTARLVNQLRKSIAVRTGTAEIVIVDNHSPFHPVVRKLEKMNGVTIRRFNRNCGFARAVNRGVNDATEKPRGKGKHQRRPHLASPRASSEWVLLLNPDVMKTASSTTSRRT
ncbi:MAG: glycosyltransferase [Gemmataceae bacterium]